MLIKKKFHCGGNFFTVNFWLLFKITQRKNMEKTKVKPKSCEKYVERLV